MKKQIQFKMILILGALLWVTSSCQKDNSMLSNGPINVGQEDLQRSNEVQHVFNDLCDLLNDANYTGMENGRTSEPTILATVAGSCGSLFIDTISMPHVLSIDFGNTNCKAPNGHWYRGKLISTFTGSYRQPGTVTTYSTVNLYQDNNRIDLNRTITNLGYLSDNKSNILHFSISETVSITFAIGRSTISQQSEMDREWIKGLDTPTGSDDVYMLTGVHNMSFSNGTLVESSIKEALRKENSYPFYVTGIEKVSQSGNSKSEYSIDYSYPGSVRDNLALVTYQDGHTEVLHMN